MTCCLFYTVPINEKKSVQHQYQFQPSVSNPKRAAKPVNLFFDVVDAVVGLVVRISLVSSIASSVSVSVSSFLYRGAQC